MRKDRQKRKGASATTTGLDTSDGGQDVEAADNDALGTDEQSAQDQTGYADLTAEEIARRRYEKRARQRQQRKKNNTKKRR